MTVLGDPPADTNRVDKAARTPTASIIMAARDAAPFVADALRSALAQTLTNIEIILVDDGSVDGTSDAVRACVGADPRVQLLRNPRSMGVSGARNRALAVARGEWVAVLDADDAFTPDRLTTLITEATTRDLDFLGDNLALRDFTTKAPLGRAYPAELMSRRELLTLGDLLERDLPGLPHRMIGYLKPVMRRAFLVAHDLRYREDVWCGEDYLLYAQAVIAGARFGLTDRQLYLYSERGGSASASASNPAVNVETSRVNRLLAHLAREHAPAFNGAIRDRQAKLDYFAATRLFRNAQFRAAGMMLARVPATHLARAAVEAIGRRLRPRAG